jgi:polyhydroxybutyrate depolymerase
VVAAVLSGALLVLAGCGADAPTGDAADGAATTADPVDEAPATSTTVFTGETGSITVGPSDRPSELAAPDGDTTSGAPLLVVLHGYDRSPDDVDELLSATEQAADRGMYVLLASGSENEWGELFWNASELCCDYQDSGVDDVDYLSSLIDEVVAERPIDPDRIFVLGHSTGGFMAYRLACDLADRVAAVAVVAGADSWPDGGCEPERPVSVLHLHGDDDGDVSYVGPTEDLDGSFPGAEETVARWAERAGCGATSEPAGEVDLLGSVPGPETSVVSYTGCPSGVDVALATMAGADHEPELDGDAVGTSVLDWLLDHPRTGSCRPR